jgi:hypothetical protein
MNNRQDPKQDRKVPQMRVRSNLNAGESVEACLNNWNYWRNEAYKACGYPKPPQIQG